MISLKELLCGVDFNSISKDHQANLMNLLQIMNKVRQAYNKPMIPTNSYRTMKHHLEIYSKKGITDPKLIPMKSNHLFGNAVDISDPKQELQAWCKANEPLLKSLGLFLEDFSKTLNWCHFQIVPYGSYKEGKSIYFMP